MEITKIVLYLFAVNKNLLSIGNYQRIPFVFVCRLLSTAKYVVCFCNCWKPLLGVFYVGGVLSGFDAFTEKALLIGFLFKQSFEKRLQCRCYFVDLQDFWEHMPFRAWTTASVLFWGPLLSLIFYLEYVGHIFLFASDNIKYFAQKSK